MTFSQILYWLFVISNGLGLKFKGAKFFKSHKRLCFLIVTSNIHIPLTLVQYGWSLSKHIFIYNDPSWVTNESPQYQLIFYPIVQLGGWGFTVLLQGQTRKKGGGNAPYVRLTMVSKTNSPLVLINIKNYLLKLKWVKRA
jgi:hypothetical protein